jgi:hypothetical protein
MRALQHAGATAAGQHGMAGILRHHTPVLHSLNWSGCAVARTGASFRHVRAAYFVPYAGYGGSPNSYSSHWAGPASAG